MTPAPTHLHLGGMATVGRYREGLQRSGHLCELFGSTSEGGLKQSLEGTIGRFKPDLVHAHDALRTGVHLLGLLTPWIVSLSGEDLHHDMVDDTRGMIVCEVVRRASRVLVPNEAAGMLLESRVAEAVARSTSCRVQRCACRRTAPISAGRSASRDSGFLIFLPGGLRPIKGQHRAMSMVSVVRSAGADVEMILAGPDQDAAYAAEVRALCQQQTGVRVLPPLAHDRMGAAYIDADVVLNTSFSEGAAPTILEAGILGRPVIAADVAGNRELIRHNETGLLFANEGDMAKQVLALYRNRSAAGALGVRIREDFQRRFSCDREISALLSAYAAA
jgi:glycosyltransferase involved in cell wall biosynthesis